VRSLETILSPTLLDALGWALIHFLWQGAGVAVLLAGTLVLLRGHSPRARYAASCAALSVILIIPALTTWKLWVSSSSVVGMTADEMLLASPHDKELSASSLPANVTVEHTKSVSTIWMYRVLEQPLTQRIESLLPWLLVAWTLGVIALSVRLFGGLIYAERLKHHGTRPVVEHWQETLARLSLQLRVTKPVQLLKSSLVQVPTAVGWLKPIILIPASAFVNLTPQQLEAILAHELAHIRRHDYLVNLLQTVAETLLFYHPAVWWVSRQIRLEREQACDDLAVSLCGDALLYARALTKVERLRQAAPPQPALAANGGELLLRIRRLVEARQQTRRASPGLIGIVFVAAFVITIACTHAALFHDRPHEPPTVEKASTQFKSESANNMQTHMAVASQSSSDDMASLIARDDTDGEDAEVRRVAIAALGDHAGTVIVMNPRTGQVYSIVNQEWALRRGWNPASVFKLVTALAGTGEKISAKDDRADLTSQSEPLNLTKALAFSSNTYFETLGERVGSERLIQYARQLGFGEPTGINYTGELAGKLPSFGLAIDAGRLGAFGEGVEVTPIQLATIISAIANGGTMLVPRAPRFQQEGSQFEAQTRRRLEIPRETLARLAPGMVAAVERGTGRGAHDPMQTVAGKTGSIVSKDSSVGIFASYAPVNDPRLVVVVATRGRDESGPVAAGITGTIYRALGRRL